MHDAYSPHGRACTRYSPHTLSAGPADSCGRAAGWGLMQTADGLHTAGCRQITGSGDGQGGGKTHADGMPSMAHA